jgi:hypothetical membrane protein
MAMRPTAIERIGIVAWLGGFILFFAVQFIVGAAWSNPPYSWSQNNVSDLGNAYCQIWAENENPAQYVCSPLHTLMNSVFVLEGLCVIAGVLLIRSLWRRSWLSRTAQACLIFAGLGVIAAGLAPADVNENAHVVFGALPIALFGNTGLLLTGRGVDPATVGRLRWAGPILGLVGILAAVLFFSHNYLGLGHGGMERLWGYNFLVWTFIVGCTLAYQSFRPTTSQQVSPLSH